jgi:outer membrane protein assembly factor BamA
VVERIDLRGLSHTRPEVVRGHILVEEGELLDNERVLTSRLALLQLGWFSRVETRVERGSERGRVVLVFELAERNTVVVTDLVFGATRAQPIYGGLGVSQQNFLGRGLGLSGGFTYGGAAAGHPEEPNRFTLRGGFFAPDLPVPHLHLVAGLSGLFLRGQEFACGDPDCHAFSISDAPRLRYQRAGGELTLGVRPGPFERILASYRFERLHAESDAPEQSPAIHLGWSNLAALSGTYEVDTRDDFFYPTEGFRTLGQVTFASRLFGGDYEYSRYLLHVESGFGLFRLPLRFQVAAGAAQGDAPFFERFYPADYSYFAIGPALGRAMELNFSTDSRYDAVLFMAGLEYGRPLWTSSAFARRAYLAVGARGVYSTAAPGGSRTTFSRTPFSADVALRLDTPVGTFNLSVGYLLDIVL